VASMADRDDWMRRLGPLYPGAVAIRQTTAMPWPGDLRATEDDSVRAAPWMVVVGGVLGVAAWLVGWLVARLGLTAALAGALAIVTLGVLSAALLDVGLARTVERWLGRDDDEVGGVGAAGLGAAGITALVGASLLRVVALLSIRPSAWLAALVVAPLIGRWAALALQRLGDLLEAPAPDRRSLVVGEVSWGTLALVTAGVAVIAGLGLGLAGLLLLVAAAAVAFAIGLVAEKRRGGLDASTLAAVAALAEVIALVGAAALAPALVSPWTA
jgi:adenosylcobinamide-GDP ribazoletransferase